MGCTLSAHFFSFFPVFFADMPVISVTLFLLCYRRGIGVFRAVKISVVNLDTKSSLNLNALAGSSVHFHIGPFADKVCSDTVSFMPCPSCPLHVCRCTLADPTPRFASDIVANRAKPCDTFVTSPRVPHSRLPNACICVGWYSGVIIYYSSL